MKKLCLIFGLLSSFLIIQGCSHPYDPANNPLLTQPLAEVVPALAELEKSTKQALNMPSFNEGSIVEMCNLDPTHFEDFEHPGTKVCDEIFNTVIKLSHEKPGVLGNLRLEDLKDRKVSDRLHQALFLYEFYGLLSMPGDSSGVSS